MLLFLATTFQSDNPPGWYQQTLPVNDFVEDIFFLLSGFNNWKIIELDSNKVIRTFDKDSNIYVDMKIFQPGEGKLYKIAPVMQEGGTPSCIAKVN